MKNNKTFKGFMSSYSEKISEKESKYKFLILIDRFAIGVCVALLLAVILFTISAFVINYLLFVVSLIIMILSIITLKLLGNKISEEETKFDDERYELTRNIISENFNNSKSDALYFLYENAQNNIRAVKDIDFLITVIIMALQIVVGKIMELLGISDIIYVIAFLSYVVLICYMFYIFLTKISVYLTKNSRYSLYIVKDLDRYIWENEIINK